MLRTSSQEGGLHQRTESPKATSGAPNGFVRPVAVASIFRPALGGSSGVSDVDGKPAVPETRRSSAVKESAKAFGSSLSSVEFSRRRQSFDTKNAVLLGQNALKQVSGNRSSPSRTLPNSETVPEYINEESSASDEKCAKSSEGSKNCGVIQSVAKNSKGDRWLTESSTSIKSSVITRKETLSIEEKEKNSKNVSHPKSVRSTKVSQSPSGSESKVAPKPEDNTPVIQNGILEENEIAVVEPRSRSRNAGRAADCVDNSSPTPYAERRRRNKFTQNTSVDSESVSQTSCALSSTKAEIIGNVPSPRKDVTGVGSDKITDEATSKGRSITVTECVQQPAVERRRRDKTSQDTSNEQNRNLSNTRVAEKDLSSQKVCEPNFNVVPEESSTSQTKSCGQQNDTNAPPKNSDEKRGSTEALDTQSVSKFRPCRRTSDVIAAKIQTIISKSDKPSTLPSSNKLGHTKGKFGSEKELKSAACSTEKDSILSQVVPERTAAEGKSLGTKADISFENFSNAVVDSVRPLSGGGSQLNKPDCTNIKKQQNVKCLDKVETSTSNSEKKSNTSKIQLETSSSVVSNVSQSSLNSEKSVVKSLVKDNKINSSQKSRDSTSLTVQTTVSSGAGSEKKN